MATEILAEETEINITNDGETEGPILNTPMVPGKIYEIILNGTSYNCKTSTAYIPMGDNGEKAPCIVFGDFSPFEGNDYVSVVDMSASNPDASFTSMTYPASLTGLAGDLVFLMINDSTLFETTGTIEIKHTYEDIEKLPYKYIYTPD